MERVVHHITYIDRGKLEKSSKTSAGRTSGRSVDTHSCIWVKCRTDAPENVSVNPHKQFSKVKTPLTKQFSKWKGQDLLFLLKRKNITTSTRGLHICGNIRSISAETTPYKVRAVFQSINLSCKLVGCTVAPKVRAAVQPEISCNNAVHSDYPNYLLHHAQTNLELIWMELNSSKTKFKKFNSYKKKKIEKTSVNIHK